MANCNDRSRDHLLSKENFGIQESSPVAHKTGVPVFGGQSRIPFRVLKRDNLPEGSALCTLGRETQPMSTNSRVQAAVFHCSGDFLQYMNTGELIPHLKEQRLLTEREVADLYKAPRLEANHKLIFNILPSKCPDAFLRFFEALKQETNHEGHRHLVDLFKSIK